MYSVSPFAPAALAYSFCDMFSHFVLAMALQGRPAAVVLCATPHECFVWRWYRTVHCKARQSTTNSTIVRGRICLRKLCFGHDGSRVEFYKTGVPTFLQIGTPVACDLRPGSSNDVAIDQCARRVGSGRIQDDVKLNAATSGRRATRGDDWECIVGSTQQVLRGSVILDSQDPVSRNCRSLSAVVFV